MTSLTVLAARSLLLVAVASLVGCAAEEDEEVGTSESAVASDPGGYEPPPPPSPPPPVTYTAKALSGRARQVLNYVAGGPAPASKCNDGTTLLSKSSEITDLRNAVNAGGPGGPGGFNTCTLSENNLYLGYVDGVNVQLTSLQCASVTSALYDAINRIRTKVDACWDNSASSTGFKASDFWHVNGRNYVTSCSPSVNCTTTYSINMEIDPESVRLNATLYASGAASATYVNSGTATSAYFLSGSWTQSSLPAGYACSTTAPIYSTTASPAYLTKTIIASGGYRRCM